MKAEKSSWKIAIALLAASVFAVPSFSQEAAWRDPYADAAEIYGTATKLMTERGFPAAIAWLEELLAEDPDKLPAIEVLALIRFQLPDDRPGFVNSYPLLKRAEALFSISGHIHYLLLRVSSVRGRMADAERYFLRCVYGRFDGFEGMTTEPDLAFFRTGQLWRGFKDRVAEFRATRGSFDSLVSGGLSDERKESLAKRLRGKFRALFGVDDLYEANIAEILARLVALRGAGNESLAYANLVLRTRERLLGPGDPETAAAHDLVGTFLERSGDLDGAESHYRSALAIREAAYVSVGPAAFAESLERQASLSTRRGKLEDAIDLYERALGMLEEAGSGETLAAVSVLSGLADAYSRADDHEAALDAYEYELDILRGLDGVGQPVATCLFSIGVELMYLERYEDAIERLRDAIAACGRLGSEGVPIEDACHFSLGSCFERMGDYGRAIEHFSTSRTLRAKLYGPESAECAYMSMRVASAYRKTGDRAKAVEWYDLALAAYEKLSSPDTEEIARALDDVASMHLDAFDYGKAIEAYGRAVGYRERVLPDDVLELAQAYVSYAFALGWGGDEAGSANAANRAIALYRAALGKGGDDQAGFFVQAAMLFSQLQKHEFALELATAALGLYESAPGSMSQEKALARMAMGMARILMGNPGPARREFDETFAQFRSAGQLQLLAEAARQIGLGYLEIGDTAGAASMFAESVAASERARVAFGSGKADFTARNLGAYRLAFEAARRLGNAADAFDLSERMRARGFLDQVTLQGALQADGVSPERRAELERLAARVAELDARVRAEAAKPSGKTGNASLARLVADRDAAEAAFKAADAALAKAAPRYAALRTPRIATLDDARALAGPDRVVVEYVLWEREGNDPFVEKNRMPACVVVWDHGEALVPLPKDFDYEGSIDAFRAAITEGLPNWKKLGVGLYGALVKPIEPYLKGKSGIVIVPDGKLAFLPFDALADTATGAPLGSRYRITLSPSVSVSMAARDAKGATGLLLFGGAKYSAAGEAASRSPALAPKASGAAAGDEYLSAVAARGDAAYFARAGLSWSDLPGTETEVRRIAAEAGGGAKTVLGADASERTVKALSASGELLGRRILHLALHGYYDGKLPEMSAVVLSEVSGSVPNSKEDGYLTVAEAALLRCGADLVMLSACETGLGAERRGDGLVGLTRAFMTAGARSVGVTLWTVYDDGTSEFMARAYRLALAEGVPFPEAFRRVRAAFMEDGRWKAPVYWAGFVVYE